MTKIQKDSTVFLASGRNHVARDSIKQLIESFGVTVLDWEASIDLTGKGAPHVWEVIEAGFKASKAFVILLTGDDEARLKKNLCKPHEHELEGVLKPQPRANVLFEAGIAMALAREKTILVQLGRLRGFSDISGFQTVIIDESRESKAALCRRLKSVGCSAVLDKSPLNMDENIPFSDSNLVAFNAKSGLHKNKVTLLRRLKSLLPFAAMGGSTEVVKDCYIGEKLKLSMQIKTPFESKMKLRLLHWLPGRIDALAIELPNTDKDKVQLQLDFIVPAPAGIHILDLVDQDPSSPSNRRVIARYKFAVREER